MLQLQPPDFVAARRWIETNGRPLEQTLCNWFFDNGPSQAVIDALAAFQNTDGGFGSRLEPDHTDDASTVLNTSIALAIHRRLKTPSDHPQIIRAVSYLESTYDSTRRAWPIRLPAKPDSVGPPWFAADSLDALMASFRGCHFNPTAEIIGYLYDHLAHEIPAWLEIARDELIVRLMEPAAEPTQHDLMCTAHLLQSTALSSAVYHRVLDSIEQRLSIEIESDPAQWTGYAFRPTLIIDEPQHPLAGCVPRALLDADLDFEINRQADDGGWHPFWDWGDPASPDWQPAEQAWTSILTERTLRVLANFGRFPEQSIV